MLRCLGEEGVRGAHVRAASGMCPRTLLPCPNRSSRAAGCLDICTTGPSCEAQPRAGTYACKSRRVLRCFRVPCQKQCQQFWKYQYGRLLEFLPKCQCLAASCVHRAGCVNAEASWRTVLMPGMPSIYNNGGGHIIDNW